MDHYDFMNIVRRLALPLIAGLLTFAFTGCATLHYLRSKPPLSKVILTQPFESDGFMFHVSMPAGEYLPLYEDGRLYYYQAPSQIAIRTIATEYQNGGFYLEAGAKTPSGWWHFDDEGNKTNGKLDGVPPGYRAVP